MSLYHELDCGHSVKIGRHACPECERALTLKRIVALGIERDSFKTAAHEWEKNWAEAKAELSALKIAQESMGAEYRAMEAVERAAIEMRDNYCQNSREQLHDALADLDRVRGGGE